MTTEAKQDFLGDDDQFLTVEQASRLTSIKVNSLYRLARDGRCPCVRVPHSRLIRFRKSALLRWLKEGEISSPLAK